MKRLLPLLLALVLGYLILRPSLNNSKVPNLNNNKQANSEKLQVTGFELQEKKSLFVPYWQLYGDNKDLGLSNSEYDRYIYFGVAGTTNGVLEDDPGLEYLDRFLALSSGSRWLTVRMTDQAVNDAVLQQRKSQTKIVEDALQIVKRHNFEGVVLDFEFNSIFDNKVDKITAFYKLFYERSKAEGVMFGTTIYGDVFYRKRPYDVEAIAKLSDEIFVMAYDLHKSRGEPGPNFPLKSAQYGYGYDRLMRDFSDKVPVEKLTFIFGMYGYDWKVDDKERPITQANPLTTAQITSRFIKSCTEHDCKSRMDESSGETKVSYSDEMGKTHIIWFEDQNSVTKKKEYLKSKGIGSTAFWAYGYF